jgi:hypothetical protein
MAALVLLVIVGTAGAPVGRLVFSDRPELATLAGPAILATVWTFLVGIAVSHGLTLQELWRPFWIATVASAALGVYFVVRDRTATLFLIPAVAALILMAPYVIHGFSSVPGSWFWDGFAYLAGGESLWRFPRGADVSGESVLYQFGHSVVQGRFISMALIGILRSAFPFGGDTQGAVGYFLLFCAFTFSSSMALLARTIMPSRTAAQALLVVVATASGPLLNLIWANNFDHFLAMSLAPAMLAIAFNARWTDSGLFAALGAMTAAQFYIYPEMALFFILPAAAVVCARIVRENTEASKYLALAVCVSAAAIFAAPLFSQMYDYFHLQLVNVLYPPSLAARPGIGLFPTFLKPACAPGALFGLYEPFQPCTRSAEMFSKLAIGLLGFLILVFTLRSFQTRTALVITVAIFTASIGFFTIIQQYDYGTYKIAETGWVPTITLCAVAAAERRDWKRSLTLLFAVLLVAASVIRIIRFDQWATVKSMDQFSVLRDRLPKDQMIALSISDPFSFEWASYYLRNHETTIRSGALPYYPSPDPTQEPYASRLKSANTIVTDVVAPSLGDPIWSNSRYFVYSTARDRGKSAFP